MFYMSLSLSLSREFCTVKMLCLGFSLSTESRAGCELLRSKAKKYLLYKINKFNI